MVLVSLDNLAKDQGHCWIARLPETVAAGEAVGSKARSCLRLFEDGKELGPAHSAHDLIREIGRGAFSHWNQALYFSASDNTNPIANGRRYDVIAPTPEEGNFSNLDIPWPAQRAKTPVNYGLLKATPQEISDAAAYAINVARSYVQKFPEGRQYLKGRSVLELGPGTSFATALVLSCWGARQVAVSDRFLAVYREAYHRPLYEQLARRLATEEPGVNLRPIERCIAHSSHSPDQILSLHSALESFESETEHCFDIVLSNAVLEHLYNPLRALKGLWNVTAQGGIGLHQVDFRDHRDFSKPLEYLLLDEISFVEMMQENSCECGNRLRPHQLQAMLGSLGFEDIRFEPNMWAEDSYLADFLPRLSASKASSYAHMEPAYLKVISGQFFFRKALRKQF